MFTFMQAKLNHIMHASKEYVIIMYIQSRTHKMYPLEIKLALTNQCTIQYKHAFLVFDLECGNN